MGFMPVSAEELFRDFRALNETKQYKILRNNSEIAQFEGLFGEDEHGCHISFIYGADVLVGDVLKNDESLTVRELRICHYKDEPQMLNAYF